MSKSLIRKNQLHPDIADLVSGYGDNFFTTPEEVQTLINEDTVRTTGNQSIDGEKNFLQRPKFNGSNLATLNEVIQASSEYIFSGNLQVNLSNGKTFGKYENGQTIPASGKTTSDVIKLAVQESIPPTVNLNSQTTIQFNQTSINNALTGSYNLNTLGASVSSASLEWRRNNAGAWILLATSTENPFPFTHSLTDTAFNTQPFNYRYIVTDSESQSTTGIFNITPASYIAPTLSNITTLTTPADLGNISTTLEATINRQSPLVPLQTYQFQYSIDNVNWIGIGLPQLSDPGTQSFNFTHNDSNLINSTNLYYRVRVIDSLTNNTLTIGSRAFTHRIYLGYSTASTLSTVNQIEQLTSVDSILSNGKARTVNNVTATQTQYTYYCYWTGAGDLTSIIQDGATTIFINGAGAFIKQNDLFGTNSFGASVTYRVYRSEDRQAFTDNTLAFS